MKRVLGKNVGTPLHMQLSCTEFCVCQWIVSVTCHSSWTKTAAEFLNGDNDDGEDDNEETLDIECNVDN